MTTATSLQIGQRYACFIEGLEHYSKSGMEFPHAACVEFVLIDDAGEIVPEIVMVHFDAYFEDPHGIYEDEARRAFHGDWKAGRVRVLGHEEGPCRH